ncbi:MAG: MerC domain-containing protein [Gemmatimonadetes bacterium]|nr:MerC domain-containing protein [Gemmatimonadota bacterium]
MKFCGFETGGGDETAFDRWGVAASSLCLVHCTVLPAVIAALPAIGLGWIASRGVDVALLVVTAVLAAVAFRRGYRCHGGAMPGSLGTGGVGLIATGVGLGERGSLVTIAGAAVLVVGHTVNLRRCRACREAAPTPKLLEGNST